MVRIKWSVAPPRAPRPLLHAARHGVAVCGACLSRKDGCPEYLELLRT